jgi:hypothetical protein
MIHRICYFTISAFMIVILTGCPEKDAIQSYRVPKPEQAADKQPVKFEVPEEWQKAPLAVMSIATYRVGEGNNMADITVTPLEGAGGGMLPNVNRWRNQLKLSPVDEAQMRKDLQETKVSGEPAYAVDLLGPEVPGRQRIVAVIASRQDQTWFFRMKGPAEVIEKHKPAFDRFMASVRFAGTQGGK